MPRTRRLVNGEEKTAYHLMSRTALDGFPFGDMEYDELVNIIRKIQRIVFRRGAWILYYGQPFPFAHTDVS